VDSDDGEAEARQELNGNTNETSNYEPMEDAINEENRETDTTSINGNEADYASKANIEDAMNKKGQVQWITQLKDKTPSRLWPPSYNAPEHHDDAIFSEKGIKVFGPPGVDTVLEGLKQLHIRKLIAPKSGTMISKEDKKASLQYLMFLKKRCTGVIKGRGFAGGRKQSPYTVKEDASLPTVAIEPVSCYHALLMVKNTEMPQRWKYLAPSCRQIWKI
jgi:hypothetical protein